MFKFLDKNETERNRNGERQNLLISSKDYFAEVPNQDVLNMIGYESDEEFVGKSEVVVQL